VVLGRYSGKGHTALTLSGKVGNETREFVYEVNFPGHTNDSKAFVADLWARRKVGYLLDEIRRNGQKKELVDEVVKLGKKHGITTPYTSYLVVPDSVPVQVATVPADNARYRDGSPQPRYTPTPTWNMPHGMALSSAPLAASATPASVPPTAPRAGWKALNETEEHTAPGANGIYYEQMREALARGDAQTGKLGVDLALQLDQLRNQDRLSQTAARQAAGRTCRQLGAVWVDEGYRTGMPAVKIKALSKAYFRILEKQPQMKEVFQLGKQVVWVTPSGCVLVIEPTGKDELSDADIDRLFVAKK
jgi:Ca-activated chloride channel family protein